MSGARDELDEYMDAYQDVLALKPGGTISAEQIASINFVIEHEREDQERATDAFHRGYEYGLERGAGAHTATLIAERDKARTEAVVSKAMERVVRLSAFRRGAQACREMMARFVEHGGDAKTARGGRARPCEFNWAAEG